jgi:hypothetical protein
MSKPIGVAIIDRARTIIANPDHWCQGSYAKSNGGVPVSAEDRSAQRYCAMGALILAAFEITGDVGRGRELAYSAARIISNTRSLIFVNDHEGYAAVLALFDKAIVDF